MITEWVDAGEGLTLAELDQLWEQEEERQSYAAQVPESARFVLPSLLDIQKEQKGK